MAKTIWTADHPLILEAKKEYLEGSINLRNLANKYKINYNSLLKVSQMDNWQLLKVGAIPQAVNKDLIKAETKKLQSIVWSSNPQTQDAIVMMHEQINSNLVLANSFKQVLIRKLAVIRKEPEKADASEMKIISDAIKTVAEVSTQGTKLYYDLVKENEQRIKNITSDSQSFSDIDKERQQLIQ